MRGCNVQKGFAMRALLVGLVAGLCVAPVAGADDLLVDLRALQARETLATTLSGVATHHVYNRLAQRVEAVKADPDAARGGVMRLSAPASRTEGLAALRFRLSDGRYRLDIWRKYPSDSVIGGQPLSDAEDPIESRYRSSTLQVAADGIYVQQYASGMGSARFTVQDHWPTVANGPIAGAMLLSLIYGSVGEDWGAAVERVASTTGMTPTPSAHPFASAERVAVAPIARRIVDGRDCAGVELRHGTVGARDIAWRIWYDPAANYLVTAIEEQSSGATPGVQVIRRRTGSDFEMVAENLWLPTQVIEETLRVVDGREIIDVYGIWRFSDLSVVPVDDAVFRLDLPPNVTIQIVGEVPTIEGAQGFSDDLFLQVLALDEELLAPLRPANDGLANHD